MIKLSLLFSMCTTKLFVISWFLLSLLWADAVEGSRSWTKKHGQFKKSDGNRGGQWRNFKQVFWGRHFATAQWRKAKQMQPMWLCIASWRKFEDTFENAQWRQVKQMQPVWLCFCSDRRFEETFENAQWRKVKQMQPVWLCILPGSLRTHLRTHNGEKSKKCNQCNYATAYVSDLRRHLKAHNGEKRNEWSNVTLDLVMVDRMRIRMMKMTMVK